MPLPEGTQLGPYQLIAQLGAGGMGEVYRARDPRLGRDVAVKVLAPSRQDAELMRRFEQEARAASALNHPNILSVFDVGVHEGTAFIVAELLDGETLRARLAAGPIPVRRAVDYASQIALALAAAHDKGIIHRDLKPENLFITGDGRMKILDFGIAKLTHPEARGGGTGLGNGLSDTPPTETEPGAILGTVGYMAPEQVQGRPADHRSDLFSFGVILYEMLAGRNPFAGAGASRVERGYAILHHDPGELPGAVGVPPALERIVRRCLEKRPGDRYQSARDLSFNLESLSGVSNATAGGGSALAGPEAFRPAGAASVGNTSQTGGAAGSVTTAPGSRRAMARWVGPAVFAALVFGLMIVAFRLPGRSPTVVAPPPAPVVPPDVMTLPSYQQLTFRRDPVFVARFSSDGNTVVYGSATMGSEGDILTTVPGRPESRSLGLGDAVLFGVSRTGDLAIGLPQGDHDNGWMLARVPLAGGAPREIMPNVEWADWMPDGEQLVVIRTAPDGKESRLEDTRGTVLYTSAKGYLSHVRVAPNGAALAVLEHETRGDDRGHVVVLDLASGKERGASGVYGSISGLAWAPDEQEVWFTAVETGVARAVYALAPETGAERLVLRVPGALTIQDLGPDGRALITQDQHQTGIMALAPGETVERELSWFDWSFVCDLSSDGKVIVFNESGEGAGQNYRLYLRRTDGSPPVQLGTADLPAFLSPDGKQVLAMANHDHDELVLLPTGAGTPRTIKLEGIAQYESFDWFPDGKRVLVQGRAASGEPPRLWIANVEVGAADAPAPARPISAPGVFMTGGHVISPDGKLAFVVSRDATGDTQVSLLPLEGAGEGTLRPIPGLERDTFPLVWTADGKAMFVGRIDKGMAKVSRLELATGKTTLWKDWTGPEHRGLGKALRFFLTPDGKSYAYSYRRMLSDLYLVDGVK